MSIISRIVHPRAASSSGELEKMIRAALGGGLTSTGIAVSSDNALTVGAVYACILVLSESVAQIPIHEYVRVSDGRKKAYDHYLYRLVHDQPNEWMTAYEFKQLIMVHKLTRGNSIWIKTKIPGQSKVRELIPVHPDFVHEIQQTEDYRLIYKIKRPKSGEIDDIPGDRILHFRGMSMNGFIGMSPIEYARESIALSMATEKHGAKLFANGARLGGIIMHPKRVSKTAQEMIINSFESKHGSVENAHKTAFFEEGMKWQNVTMTAEDAQFLESRKFQRSEIAGIFRVPSHMINDLEKATFSNVEHLDLAFVKHSLMPHLVSTEETMKKDLMTPTEKEKYFFKFNAGALLRGDMKSRYEAHSRAILSGFKSRNEVRADEELNPVDGLDEYLYPTNMDFQGGKNESKTTT